MWCTAQWSSFRTYLLFPCGSMQVHVGHMETEEAANSPGKWIWNGLRSYETDEIVPQPLHICRWWSAWKCSRALPLVCYICVPRGADVDWLGCLQSLQDDAFFPPLLSQQGYKQEKATNYSSTACLSVHSLHAASWTVGWDTWACCCIEVGTCAGLVTLICHHQRRQSLHEVFCESILRTKQLQTWQRRETSWDCASLHDKSLWWPIWLWLLWEPLLQ